MELIIYDAEIQNLADFCDKTGGELEVFFYRYIRILESISENALKSGDARARLDSYISYASKMLGDLAQNSREVQSNMKNYLTQIDNADQFLF